MASIHQIYDERLRRLREIEEEASDMIGKKIIGLRALGKEEFSIDLDDNSSITFDRGDDGNIKCHWKQAYKEKKDHDECRVKK